MCLRRAAFNPKCVVIRMENLQALSNECARALSFSIGKLTLKENIYLVGTNAHVQKSLQDVDAWEEYNLMDQYDPSKIATSDSHEVASAAI